MYAEIKKVDGQGRIVLPSDWRETDLKNSNEVLIIREKGYLKIIPRVQIDITQFFDTVDFGDEFIDAADNWSKAENILYQKEETKKK